VVELGFENSAFAALRAWAPGPRGGSESPRGVSAVKEGCGVNCELHEDRRR
jgi:hypothetical protein